MPESYPFLRIDDDEGLGIVYSFANHHFGYTVYFNERLYADLVIDYDYLNGKSYSFGFYNTLVCEDDKTSGDLNVSFTIVTIVEDFFSFQGEEAVVLFHCDSHDSRQFSRHKVFWRWYKNSQLKDAIFLHQLEVSIGDVTHYLGFICLNTHPDIERLKSEFEEAAQKIAPAPTKA